MIPFKKSMLGLSLLVFSSSLFAQGNVPEQQVATEIAAVKLHLQGAEIVHNSKLNIPAGRSQFVFNNLSSKLYPQTIQLAIDAGEVRILSVTSKINYLARTKEDKRIELLRDSVEIVKAKLDGYKDERNAYLEEKEVLKSNRNTKGTDEKIDLELLKSAADFHFKKNLTINQAITALDNKMVDENQKLFDYRLQLRELNAKKSPTSEIYLVVESSKAVSSDVNLRYVVADCGWAAIYDLESNDLNSSIELRYRALAYNNTGHDWNNVKLTLSTSDPLKSATQPTMAVWNLDDYSAYAINEFATMNINNSNVLIQSNINNAPANIDGYKKEAKELLGEDWRADVDYETEQFKGYLRDKSNAPKLTTASLDVPDFNVDFEINLPYTIPSDKKPYSVDVKQHKLEASYKYFAVPKLDKDAFLLVQVTGWEDLDLVSGPVNIYNTKRYVGQSNLDIRNISDTLQISLGRDKDVVVTRTKVKAATKKQLLGNTKKASIAYDIVVKNNHSKSINIEVLDQLPITTDKDVIITLDERGGAEYSEKTGELAWRFTLEPSKSKSFNFGFSIKYPKDKQVNIQYNKSRNIQQMRYF